MINLRPILPADIDLICRHREAMFREAGRAEVDLAAMAIPFQRWLEPRLAENRYFGFVAEKEGVSVGGIGLMEIDWPPHPAHPIDDRRGYILNVYVEPIHRGRRIARMLMQASDAEFVRRGITYAILHTTTAGRRLYERTGWTQTSEMAKSMNPAGSSNLNAFPAGTGSAR